MACRGGARILAAAGLPATGRDVDRREADATSAWTSRPRGRSRGSTRCWPSARAWCTTRTKGFYVELQPINDNFVPEAMAVCGMDLERAEEDRPASPRRRCGSSPSGWPRRPASGRCSSRYPVAFDWMFVAWYFHKFLGHNPFGVSGARHPEPVHGAGRRRMGALAQGPDDRGRPPQARSSPTTRCRTPATRPSCSRGC